MSVSAKRWLQISLFNLLLVAGIGVLLRYKIVFPLPGIEQGYLLQGHSHFAFAGWVTQALMTLLVLYLAENGQSTAFKKYRWLLYANLFTAYGMVISFPLDGYGLFSIIFSTLSIFVAYIFAIFYFKDLDKLPVKNSSCFWFKSAIFFNALSSLGTFSLAFMLVTKQTTEHLYLESIYFFLHFQYNGWFFFACMGLLNYLLIKAGFPDNKLRQLFWLFFIACIPDYFLSTLWLSLQSWLYWIVVFAALLQLYAWIVLVLNIKKYINHLRKDIPKSLQIIFAFSAIALSIKLVLQALSVVPSLSKLAFGFRPIVIGYLHLVLLGVITLFILGYIFSQRHLPSNKTVYCGLFVFIAGVILNELILMLQGTGDIWYTAMPNADFLLLAAAFILFSGMFLLNYGTFRSGYAPAHKFRTVAE
ncbi:MAG TPA: hypothetical protein VHD35_04820 [Chitinophagaceae bacterium]|nr:hypothetical protein [Chitinophagaceae bacterium]